MKKIIIPATIAALVGFGATSADAQSFNVTANCRKVYYTAANNDLTATNHWTLSIDNVLYSDGDYIGGLADNATYRSTVPHLIVFTVDAPNDADDVYWATTTTPCVPQTWEPAAAPVVASDTPPVPEVAAPVVLPVEAAVAYSTPRVERRPVHHRASVRTRGAHGWRDR